MKRTMMAMILALGFGVSGAQAGLPVVTGDGLGTNPFSSLSRESTRVLQQFYDASFFTSVQVPTQITAMSFRLPPSADVNYPANNDISFSRYDITLAKASAATALADGLTSATFADNMDSPMVVRAGPLTIPQESFISNASGVDAEFSFIINFDTPYLYTPGDDLVMLVRHTGHGDNPTVQTRWNFDGYTWVNGSVVSTGADPDVAVGNFGPGTFNVANKIMFLPEPSALMLLALGGVAMLRRRRIA